MHRLPVPACDNFGIRQELLVFTGAFVGATVVALLAGATNLGTALTFGQLAFAATLVAVLLRGRWRPPAALGGTRRPPPPPKRRRRRR